jgi:hypothetical protein
MATAAPSSAALAWRACQIGVSIRALSAAACRRMTRAQAKLSWRTLPPNTR